MSPEAFADLKRAKRQNYEEIYLKEGMVDDAENVAEEMFAELYDRLLDDVRAGDESSPVFRHHIARLSALSRTLDPASYLAEGPDQVVVDYLASMTDSYFMALYDHLFPTSGKAIMPRGYCFDLA